MDLQTLRQDFIEEVMLFSPKYNLVTATALAEQMSEEELRQYLSRLERINEWEETRLAELHETDPDAFEREVAKKREEEERVDDEYFGELEKKLMAATDGIDEEATRLENEINAEADAATQEMTEEYERTSDLLNAFFGEIEETEQQLPPPPKHEPTLEEVQKELQDITSKASDNTS